MNILVVSEKVDKSDVFHGWIEEFSLHVESVIVICREKGQYNLPESVRVFSLGMEERKGRILQYFRFLKLIWKKRNEYDGVFVYMNPTLLLHGVSIWKIAGKKITQWFEGEKATSKFKGSIKYCDKIFTSSKNACPVQNDKVKAVGYGIDTSSFPFVKRNSRYCKNIAMFGKISDDNDQVTVLKAALKKDPGDCINYKIIGPIEEDVSSPYFNTIKQFILSHNLSSYVEVIGKIEYKGLLSYLSDTDFIINQSSSNLLNKEVLLGMATGIPVLSSNKILQIEFPENEDLTKLYYEEGNAEELAKVVKSVATLSEDDYYKLSMSMRETIEGSHSLKKVIPLIVDSIEGDNK